MARLCVRGFTVSLDGYGAGPRQSLDAPLGAGGENLHQWMLSTRAFKSFCRQPGGETGIDNDFAERSFENVGAWIMGRHMFAPSRGPWKAGDPWKGWWGDEPSYHCDVFVLTHHERPPLPMKGGTTFHFVTGGIHEALRLATAAARGKDVRVGGGVSTVRQYLQAGLIDELHLVTSPVLLGSGEHLLAGIDMLALGYRCTTHAVGRALHVVMTKNAGLPGGASARLTMGPAA